MSRGGIGFEALNARAMNSRSIGIVAVIEAVIESIIGSDLPSARLSL